MPILDTNLLIALAQRDTGAEALLERSDGPFLVPDVVAVEFLTGFDEPDEREQALAFLEQSFTILHGNRAWVLDAAAFRQDLRRRGALVRHADLWIASWARHAHAAVYTKNVKDFEALGVEAVSW